MYIRDRLRVINLNKCIGIETVGGFIKYIFEEASKKDFYIIRMPDMLFNVVNSDGKSVYCCIKHKGDMENDSNFDVVDFITDTNMKEKELTMRLKKKEN